MKPPIAYYNEIDPYAAAWLRNLIAAGHIAPGVVDERSIEDITPEELYEFTQCHFFAGVGVWSLALRDAGWADNRPIWTGSCPCQPFSAAGAGAGFADERHLWPAFHHLIAECRPAVVAGEQVASKAVDPWIDLVQDDLEALGYAVGAVAFPSAGVGAPHIRDRTYWVADASGSEWLGRADDGALLGDRSARGRHQAPGDAQRGSGAGRMADANGWYAGAERQQRGREQRQQPQDGGGAERVADAESLRREGQPLRASGGLPAFRVADIREPGRMADADGRHASTEREQRGGQQRQQPQDGRYVQDGLPGPTNGQWRDADWLFCRDGKWRPVEPGTFPLAHGAASRVGRLRAYGNAINAEAACAWIKTVMECLP